MRHFSFLVSLLLFASILDASYLRTIRILSFEQDADSQKVLLKLNEFISQHENILQLQSIHKFEFKIVNKQDYKMIVVEPLRERSVVEELLQTLRIKYPSAYPRNIENRASEFDQNIVPVQIDTAQNHEINDTSEMQTQKAQIVQTVETSTINEIQEIPKSTEMQNENIELITPVVVKEEVLQKDQKQFVRDLEVKENKLAESNYYLWQILLGITFLLLLVFIKLWISANRKNEVFANAELINEGKILQLEDELKSKDKLVSHVSHELRTPMTAIMGLSHLLLESELNKIQKDNIARIEHSAQHLLSLINDILDVSKLKAGELKIEKSEFNINDIVEYVLNIISIQAKDNGIRLSLDINIDVPSRVIGDSLRLGQVLINILGNAVKFTKDGEIALKIAKLSNFNDSLVLEFAISDTGIGMTEEQIEKIFQSYSQADGSISREYGGTGLGLTITKQLIEMMNGSIRVKSKKDVGTTFIFSIQFKLKDSQNKRQYRLPSSSFLNKRVLIVDRSNHNVISLKRSLEYFKYQVHSIPSFEEAAFDKKMKFDIIIIYENRLTNLAVASIREMKKNQNFKLVILSEFYQSLNHKLHEDLNIDAHLRNPFTQQSILNMIVELYVVKSVNSIGRKQNIKEKLKELGGKKLLVAEDNEVNHKVISGLLSKTGIELTFVTDGQSAVDLVQKGIHFDMILMDINMPIMDGLEATKEIRKQKSHDDLPIIALSADVMSDAIKQSLDVGMQGHISKPIIVDVFYKKIYDTLSNLEAVTIEKNTSLDLSELSSEEYEELSISSGLNRCHKDVEFYKTILKDFKLMYADSGKKFEQLCNESHFSQARHLAMEIKDIALNIGAYNLCESAANMEYEFEKGARSNYKKLIVFYNEGLMKLFEDIDKYLQAVEGN